jgi:hypothetical protein
VTPQVKAPNPIIGERIDGPANIRDQINGKLLFSLNDHTLVSCTSLKNDWYQIGLLMDVDANQSGMLDISEGRKIRVDGKEVGEIKSDMTVYTGTDGEKSWAELIGYTHKDNIKPESIIETALSEYMKTVDNERSVAQLQNFIQHFRWNKMTGLRAIPFITIMRIGLKTPPLCGASDWFFKTIAWSAFYIPAGWKSQEQPTIDSTGDLIV